MKRLFLFLLAISMISCSDNKVEVLNDAGTVIERFEILEDSTKHGLYEAFFDNGDIQEKSTYMNGALDGTRTIYHSNGNVEVEENYVKDVMEGSFKAFHENGKLNIEVPYKNGQMNGTLKRYYDTGSLQEEVAMVGGMENGPFKEYFANGKVEWEGNYIDGDNEEGLLTQFSEDGSTIKKMECDNGVCRTIWTKEEGDITPAN